MNYYCKLLSRILSWGVIIGSPWVASDLRFEEATKERVRFRFKMEQTGNGGVEHDFKWRTERTDGQRTGKRKGRPTDRLQIHIMQFYYITITRIQYNTFPCILIKNFISGLRFYRAHTLDCRRIVEPINAFRELLSNRLYVCIDFQSQSFLELSRLMRWIGWQSVKTSLSIMIYT